MSTEKELPEGWKWVKLKDVVSLLGDGLHGTPEYSENGEYFFINGNNLSNGKIEIKANTKSVSVSEYEKHKKQLSDKSILVSINGTIGNVAFYNNEKIILGKSACYFNVTDVISKHFLMWLLKDIRFLNYALNSATGSTIKNVSLKSMREFTIPLPPIAIQNDIVLKIDELFSELDKGIENLKTAQQQLAVYRQAVLKSAFEGKLTNKDLKDGELPKSWVLKKVSDICNVVRGGSPRPAGDLRYYNGTIPFLKVADITKDSNKYLLAFTHTIKEAGLHKTRKISPDTLLLSNSGATLGVPKICMIDATMNDGIAAFLNLDKRSNHYLYYFWLSKTKELRNINMGAAQPNLNTDIIKNYVVPYCSFAEQSTVVKEIENLLSVCDKIEETITNSLQQAEALKQSILKKAFEGKLVKAGIQTEAKVISINAKRDVWERKVLAGKIISACHHERSFGTTKFQKLLYLCEQHAQLLFDTHYIKQTAGPLDATFIYPFIREAKKSEWFIQDTGVAPYHFEPLNKLENLTSDYPKFFEPVSDKINYVLGLLKDKNTDDSELVATVYAIWNNYILEQQELDPEVLTNEVYDWSKSKAKFSKAGILAMWNWMKEVGLVPIGFGKVINKVTS